MHITPKYKFVIKISIQFTISQKYDEYIHRDTCTKNLKHAVKMIKNLITLLLMV